MNDDETETEGIASQPTVTARRQSRLTSDVQLVLKGQPPSDLLTELAHAERVVDALRTSVARAAVACDGTTRSDHVADLLKTNGVTALHGLYAETVATLADPDVVRGERMPVLPVAATAAFGDANPGPLGIRQPFEAWETGPAALLAVGECDLSVSVEIRDEFREQRRSQREEICRVLETLARVGEVELVASSLTQRWLRETHRDDLAGVHEACSASRGSSRETLVATAAEMFAVGDRVVETLETVGTATGQATDYDSLTDELAVSRATVRTHATRLAEYDLVERYGPQSERRIEVTDVGRQFIEQELAAQRRLSDGVVRDRNVSEDNRVSRREHGEGETGDDRRSNRTGATTQWLDRATTAAAVGVGDTGTVTAVDYPAEKWSRDGRGWPEPRLSVPEGESKAVVAVDVQSPLQLVTSTALALWDPPARETLWTDDRLSRLETALGEETTVLRDIRTVGWVGDDVDTARAFVDELGAAATRLRELTAQLGQSEDPNPSLRGEVMQLAHGMIGVATQVADLCGIEVTYLYQFPEYSRDWGGDSKRDRRAAVAETLARSLTIQSAYNGHTAYRHLFEDRESKREQAFSVTVDATEPTGELLSSVVLIGDGVSAFGTELREALESREPHDDAPEFAVDVPVRTAATHAAWRETATRAAAAKNLRVPAAAVKTLRALVATPFDLADGVVRDGRLASDRDERGLRGDELRRVVAGLPCDRLLPEQPPTVRKVVQALAAAETAVPTAAVVEAADISRASFRRYAAVLSGLDVITETGEEESRWRLRVAFADESETVYPRAATETWSRADVLLGLAHGTIPVEHLSDPEHPVMGQLLGMQPPQLTALEPAWPELETWRDVIEAFLGIDPPAARDAPVGRAGRVTQAGLGEAERHRVATDGGRAMTPATGEHHEQCDKESEETIHS